jgi:hypothetical protein
MCARERSWLCVCMCVCVCVCHMKLHTSAESRKFECEPVYLRVWRLCLCICTRTIKLLQKCFWRAWSIYICMYIHTYSYIRMQNKINVEKP